MLYLHMSFQGCLQIWLEVTLITTEWMHHLFFCMISQVLYNYSLLWQNDNNHKWTCFATLIYFNLCYVSFSFNTSSLYEEKKTFSLNLLYRSSLSLCCSKAIISCTPSKHLLDRLILSQAHPLPVGDVINPSNSSRMLSSRSTNLQLVFVTNLLQRILTTLR